VQELGDGEEETAPRAGELLAAREPQWAVGDGGETAPRAGLEVASLAAGGEGLGPGAPELGDEAPG